MLNFLLALILTAHASPSNFDIANTELQIPGREEQSWKPPNFQNQEAALGYQQSEFVASAELRDRVDFWVQVYGKYSSKQGILHDRNNLKLIYGVADFSEFVDDTSLSRSRIERLKEKLVGQKRKEIISILLKLSATESPDQLSPEELRIWNLFPVENKQIHIRKAANPESIRYQLGQSDYFLKGIYYSGRYIRQMERIFREEGLPVELTRLPFVESSFNIFARSKVGASGIWQFMRTTGRAYMKINAHVDERNDPLAASRAAAKLLKSNFKALEMWPLAITGYNHGPSGVKRLVKQYKTNQLHELIERVDKATFQFASKNFYACFLAALEVESHADKYFAKPVIAPELPFETYILPKSLAYGSLIHLFGGDAMKAELLNPQFTARVKRGRLPMPKGTKIRIPLEKSNVIAAMIKKPGRNLSKESNGDKRSF